MSHEATLSYDTIHLRMDISDRIAVKSQERLVSII